MLKRYGTLAAALFAAMLFIAPAMAEDKDMDKGMDRPAMMDHGKDSMGKGPKMDPAMMKEHHKMMQDTLTITRDIMVILKDLNHKPNAEQQKKLDEMIKRMDEIIKHHEDMMQKRQDRMGW